MQIDRTGIAIFANYDVPDLDLIEPENPNPKMVHKQGCAGIPIPFHKFHDFGHSIFHIPYSIKWPKLWNLWNIH